MGIPHLYTVVEGTASEFGGHCINMRGGEKVFLPMIAGERVRSIRAGDRILIDFEFWNTERELARIYVFREGIMVTHFGVGKDACSFEGIAL
jgi:hypothetical protein